MPHGGIKLIDKGHKRLVLLVNLCNSHRKIVCPAYKLIGIYNAAKISLPHGADDGVQFFCLTRYFHEHTDGIIDVLRRFFCNGVDFSRTSANIFTRCGLCLTGRRDGRNFVGGLLNKSRNPVHIFGGLFCGAGACNNILCGGIYSLNIFARLGLNISQ